MHAHVQATRRQPTARRLVGPRHAILAREQLLETLLFFALHLGQIGQRARGVLGLSVGSTGQARDRNPLQAVAMFVMQAKPPTLYVDLQGGCLERVVGDTALSRIVGAALIRMNLFVDPRHQHVEREPIAWLFERVPRAVTTMPSRTHHVAVPTRRLHRISFRLETVDRALSDHVRRAIALYLPYLGARAHAPTPTQRFRRGIPTQSAHCARARARHRQPDERQTQPQPPPSTIVRSIHPAPH